MSVTTHSIPRLLDSAPELTSSNNDIENRNNLVLCLLAEIEAAKSSGDLTLSVCLYCPNCQALVQASTRVPEPVHHCGAVLEMATCACCQKPATHWREHPESGVEAWATGHSNKGVSRG